MPCVGRCLRPLLAKSCSEGHYTTLCWPWLDERLRIALENILFDIGRRPKTQGCAARRVARRPSPKNGSAGTPPSYKPSRPARRAGTVLARPPPPAQNTHPLATVGATALTTSSNRLPSAPRRTTTASLKMEDFGLLKGTVFDYGREWTKSGMTEQQKGSLEDCMSEATMEKYMNDNGLRFKMNKTAKEREGLKLFGGLLPEFEVNIPILNVDLKVAAPEVESIWEAIGFTATSNNAARVAEKQKAVAKEKKNAEKFGDILAYWKEKYGYSKYYPGSWFYYDQLSTDPDENGRGQINTPANRQMSGFRMRKGGFYLDGTKDTRT